MLDGPYREQSTPADAGTYPGSAGVLPCIVMSWKVLGVIAGAVLLAGLTSGALVIAVHAQSAAQHDQAVIARLAARLGTDEAQLTQEGQQVTSLQGEVAGLTVPSDPLSAYDQICNQDFTNSQTGVSQPFYFPCTNQAQTIPQPGT